MARGGAAWHQPHGQCLEAVAPRVNERRHVRPEARAAPRRTLLRGSAPLTIRGAARALRPLRRHARPLLMLVLALLLQSIYTRTRNECSCVEPLSLRVRLAKPVEDGCRRAERRQPAGSLHLHIYFLVLLVTPIRHCRSRSPFS